MSKDTLMLRVWDLDGTISDTYEIPSCCRQSIFVKDGILTFTDSNKWYSYPIQNVLKWDYDCEGWEKVEPCTTT